MDFPLVSIVIPTYNCADFIKECLDSVLSQNYPHLEVIISDDASTDGTREILQDYQRKHFSVIKLNLNEKNLSITKNCNLALSLCHGKYISFFAGDDVMLPEKISKQVKYMEAHPECAITYHNVEVFFCGNLAKRKPYLHHYAVKARNGDVKTLIKHGPFTASCSTMALREKIPAAGYDDRITLASDGLLWVEILEMGGEIHYIDEVLARYRIHGSNISRDKFPETALDFLIHQSKLLIKHPEQAADILSHYADGLFFLAKHSNKSIEYLKASFRVKMRLKTFVLILVHYLSMGKLSFNSKYIRSLNHAFVRTRIFMNMILQRKKFTKQSTGNN